MELTRFVGCSYLLVGSIVEMDRKTKEVRVRNPAGSAGEAPRVFTMDNVFDESLSQQTVYEETCRPIVANIIQGYNGTIFAYGQTGTGKTFTSVGNPAINTVRWFACLL